jgi:hypothetical protein
VSGTLQRWFVIVWAVAVLVVGVLAIREQEQATNDEQWDRFVCALETGQGC